MADNYFVVERGDLPEWHKLYKKGSTEEVNPFITTTSRNPSIDYYSPTMSVCANSGDYTKFWKKSELFETAQGGLTYSGSAPGIAGVKNLKLVWELTEAETHYRITRPYNNSYGGYDLVVTNQSTGTSRTLISANCPTCLVFELCGPGGGGSSKYAISGVEDNPGNGGGGGAFMVGVIDFSVATEGINIKVGKGGDGGTYEGATALNIIERRQKAIGNEGTSSVIQDVKALNIAQGGVGIAYYGFTVRSGKGGVVRPYNSSTLEHSKYVTNPAAGGECYKTRLENPSVITSTSIPAAAGGIIILGFKNGAPGGVHGNDWSDDNPNGDAPSTNLGATTIQFAPGLGWSDTKKTYNFQEGGPTWPDNLAADYGGGGASMLGKGSASPSSTPGYGGGGSGAYKTTSSTVGQKGGNGYFALYYDTI